MLKPLVPAGFALAALILAACNSKSNTVTPISMCPSFPSSFTVALVYPANGATGVSTTVNTIVVASNTTQGPGNAFSIQVVAASGGIQAISTTTAAVPSPLPTPNTTPSFSNPVYYAYALSTALGAGQTYNVNAAYNNGTNCTLNFNNQIGSFRT